MQAPRVGHEASALFLLMRRMIICALLFGAMLATARSAAPTSFAINIHERAGTARNDAYAVYGLPLPRDWNVAGTDRLTLKDSSGTAIPAQFEILARWGGASDNAAQPARWLLVTHTATLADGASEKVYLHKTGTPVTPATAISITHPAADRILVDTGAARFTLNTTDFNLLQQVRVAGQDMLAPLSAHAAIAYQQLNGTNVVAGGAPNPAARPTQVEIERAGPLYAVIKARGSIMHGAAPVLDYTARLHFYAGCAGMRMDFTVENNHPIMTGEGDQPANVHNKGAINSVYIGDLRLNIKPRETGGGLHVLTEQSVTAANPAAAVRVFQGSSGKDHWNAYTGTPGWPGHEASAHPRLQSYCTNRGFIVTSPAGVVTGDHSEGWMAVYRAGGPQINVAVRDFWQNYPKALEAAPDGTLSVVLYPNGTQFHHNFRVGEQKTDSIWLAFGSGALTHAQGTAQAAAFNRPLFGIAEPAWYAQTGVLGEVPAARVNTWPLYEHYVRTAFTPNPQFDPAVDDPNFGNSSMQAKAIDGYDFYGWQDYGDVPLDYESFDEHCAGQMNLKYWFTYGMLMQYCRSGDPRWLDLGLPAARHLSDLDILHIPDSGPAHWAHGAYFGHSQHDERGNLNPNRNWNSPSVDLVFGVPDLLLAYYLTGERRFRDVALEGLEGNYSMSQFSDFTNPIPDRNRANLIFACIEGYRETGAARWLAQLTNIVSRTADLGNKSWLTDPDAYGAAHPGVSVKLFTMGQALWSMGRYLDFRAEYGQADPFATANALKAYSDFIINHATTNVGADASATLFEYYFDRSGPSYVDHNNWALVMADVMAYTYKYSARSNYLRMAARFYKTGVTDPQWSGDPPVYIDTKGLVNSINWGLVYMNQTVSGPPDPPPDPDPPQPTVGPAIRANNIAGALTVTAGTPVSISVALTAGDYAGIPADWWVVAIPFTGNWYYMDDRMVWTEFSAGDLTACRPAYQGALGDLTAVNVLSDYRLGRGVYNFYFAVDVQDGILNYPDGPILYDSVTVTVEQP